MREIGCKLGSLGKAKGFPYVGLYWEFILQRTSISRTWLRGTRSARQQINSLL